MEGGVRKRGKSWYYYFEVGKVDGKRKKIERKGGNTKKEAQIALRNALNDFERCGSVIAESNMSMSDYLDYWYDEYVVTNCKHNTQMNYRQVINAHIKPVIGIYKLKSLNPAVLQDLLNLKQREGYSRKTISIIKCILSNSLKHAVYPWALIKENPIQYVMMPKFDEIKTDKDSLEILPLEDFKKLISVVSEDDSFYIPLHIGFYTGMRVSEVAGLTWDCVNFRTQTIIVEKILVNKHGEWIFGTPKTKSSHRTVHIGNTLIEILRRHKLRQESNHARYGEHYTVTDFVCTKENGQNVTPSSIKTSTRKYSQQLGISFNFHSLRHYGEYYKMVSV